MLQQTRAGAVRPYFEAFLRRFPSVAALAAASQEDVLAAWTGLGYYRRARNLHAAARVLVATRGGRLPRCSRDLQALPGIGRYTANAVASIAFGEPVPVVDGNVRRVLSRLLAIDHAETLRGEAMWDLAGSLLDPDHPGDSNQALMELGATICTPRAPRCPSCPVCRACRGRRSATPEAFPPRTRRAAPQRIVCRVAWLRRAGRILLEQRTERGLLAGLWELPAAHLVRDAGIRLGGDPVAVVRHSILDRRLLVEVFEGAPATPEEVRAARRLRGGSRDGGVRRWARPAELGSLPVTGLTRKIAGKLTRGDPGDRPPRSPPSETR